MSDLLNTYEKNFRKNNDMIMSNFNKLNIDQGQTPTNNNNDMKLKINRTYILDETDKLIEEQKRVLKQMEIEVSSLLNREEYEEYSVKLSSFKKSLDLNKKNLNKLYSKEESKNNSFMSESNLLSEHNNILIDKEKYLYQRNEKLQQVRRSLSSTEDMGTNIIVNMDNQTESMRNMTGKLKNMRNDLHESGNVLNKMKRRVRKNKSILVIFGILLGLILAGVLTTKLYKKFKN
jgi:hypothetical protein